MASGRMHPVAERALHALGKAGRKALERAGVEAATTLADSLLEDVEQSSGGLSERARDARAKINDRKEEHMGKRSKKRAADEEDDDDVEEEEVEEDEDEDEDDDEELDATELIDDAEVMVRNALYILEAGIKTGKVSKKLVAKLGDVHEEIIELLEDE